VNKFIFNYKKVNNIINSPVITDKLKTILTNNKNSFLVQINTNKSIIKATLECLFNIKIIKLNTYRLPKKTKRFNKFIGIKKQYKKVIITVDSVNEFNLFIDN